MFKLLRSWLIKTFPCLCTKCQARQPRCNQHARAKGLNRHRSHLPAHCMEATWIPTDFKQAFKHLSISMLFGHDNLSKQDWKRRALKSDWNRDPMTDMRGSAMWCELYLKPLVFVYFIANFAPAPPWLPILTNGDNHYQVTGKVSRCISVQWPLTIAGFLFPRLVHEDTWFESGSEMRHSNNSTK